MSFYGNVTYYLSNAFNKIIYRNANSKSGNNASSDSKTGPGIPAYEYSLIPRNRKDETILETGNKWIVFADHNGTVGNNQIQIYHQVIDSQNEEDVIVASTAIVTPEETDTADTELDFGSIIRIPSITYDNAGHIVDKSSISYKLPISQGDQEITELDKRISYIAYLLTGSPKYYEEVPDPVPLDFASYSYRISQLENNLGRWNYGYGTTNDPMTVGDTLHNLAWRVGLVNKVADPNNEGSFYYPIVDESVQNPEYPSNSLIRLAKDADDSARITREYARSNRAKINTLITTINSIHHLDIEPLSDN